MSPKQLIFALVIGAIAGIASLCLNQVFRFFWPSLPEELKYQSSVTVSHNRLIVGTCSALSFVFLGLIIWTFTIEPDFSHFFGAPLSLFCGIWFGILSWPKRSFLRISRDGFHWKYMFSERSYEWSEIAELRLTRGGLLPGLIGYDFLASSKRTGRFSKWASGGDELIPSNFGKKPDEILAIMEHFRSMAEQCRA